MAGSGSYARGERPRSVSDPLKEPYEEMIVRQRAYNARQEASQPSGIATNGSRPTSRGTAAERRYEHPSVWESIVPIWGSGKEALADWEDGKHAQAVVDGAMAASDAMLAKSLVTGVAKGGLKLAGPHVWRTKPWEKVAGARQWLGEKGFLKPGQPGHHWLFEQSSKMPDWIKNQPLFIKGMKDAVQHGRVHGPYTSNGVRLPQYNILERFWHGTPNWAKAGSVSSAGHGGLALQRRKESAARSSEQDR